MGISDQGREFKPFVLTRRVGRQDDAYRAQENLKSNLAKGNINSGLAARYLMSSSLATVNDNVVFVSMSKKSGASSGKKRNWRF